MAENIIQPTVHTESRAYSALPVLECAEDGGSVRLPPEILSSSSTIQIIRRHDNCNSTAAAPVGSKNGSSSSSSSSRSTDSSSDDCSSVCDGSITTFCRSNVSRRHEAPFSNCERDLLSPRQTPLYDLDRTSPPGNRWKAATEVSPESAPRRPCRSHSPVQNEDRVGRNALQGVRRKRSTDQAILLAISCPDDALAMLSKRVERTTA